MSSLSRDHAGRRRRFAATITTTAVMLFLVGCVEGETAPIPPPLMAVAHHGESVYDYARAGDWSLVAASLDSLHRGASALEADAGPDSSLMARLAAQMDTLDAAVAAHARPGTLRTANEVTRLAAELMRPFNPPSPVELTLLDHDGRSMELWAETGELAKLSAAATTLRQTWDAVRIRVESRPGGATVAATFEDLVMQAERGATLAAYGELAPRILDEVDNLERLFPPDDPPD